MVRIRKLLCSLGYSVLDPTPLPPSVVAMYRPDNRPAKRTPTPGKPSRGGRGKELDVTKTRLIPRARNHSSPSSSEGASNMLGFSFSPSYNEADQEVDQPSPCKRKYYIKEEELIEEEEEFDEEDNQEDADEEDDKEEEEDDEDFKKVDFQDFKEEEEVEEEVLKVVKVERDRTKLKIQLKREKRTTRKSTTHDHQNGEEEIMRNNMMSEISRCTRVNERGWRCNGQRVVGYSLCQNHLGERSTNSTTVNEIINTDNPETDEAIVKGHPPSMSTDDSYSYGADDDTEGID